MGSDTDTIVALATAPGRAGVAVIRASGPEATGLIQLTTGRDVVPRVAHIRQIRDASGDVIDEGLILFFQGPASFTGEDVAEFQVHGSRAVTSRLIECLASQPNCRVAEAGEFTLRAFRNGKIDLTQAEGLADLIDAETEVQRKQALDVLQGAFRSQVLTWRQDLLRSVALIEATVDFADEDVPVDVWPEVRSLISGARTSMETALDGADAAQSVREGFEVAVIGRPNVGKSTLLNAIAGREAALVSDVAGTTRDAIEVKVDLDGLPVAFVDLAGIRETIETVEALGVARARTRAAEADLRLHLLGEDEVSPLEIGVDDIVVRGKADLGIATELLSVSGLSGQGVDVLLLQIRSALEDRVAGRSLISHQRQRSAISRGVTSLTEIEEAITTGLPEELISESLRSALRELEGIVGYIGVESVLGEIFSRFCIGK